MNDQNDLKGSILKETKKLLGLMGDYEAFDTDIIVFINAAFAVLNQLGVGPDAPFHICGYEERWTDFTLDLRILPMVKDYIYLKVKKSFEGPTMNSYVISAIDGQIAEYEFRLNVACDLREAEEDDV